MRSNPLNKPNFKRILLTVAALICCMALGLTIYAAAPESFPQEESSSSSAAEGVALPGGAGNGGEDSGSTALEPILDEAPSVPESTSTTETPSAESTIQDTSSSQSQSVEPSGQTDQAKGSASEQAEEAELTEEPIKEGEEDLGADLSEEEVVSPFGVLLDETSALVSSYAELSAALAGDNNITAVYFANDITAEAGGILIHPNKAAVTIDGLSPEGAGPFTFTQYSSSSMDNTIRVDSAGAATKAITLRNLNLVGQNVYGVASARDAATGVTITHENVTYTGPQAVQNRGGTTRFVNSSYTLQSGGGSSTNELAETRYAEFSGAVSINVPSSTNSALWLTASDSSLLLHEGAQVTLNTAYYFIYTGGNRPTVTLSAGASLSVTDRRGFTYGDQRISRFVMAEGASLSIAQESPESWAALRVSELFQMAPGSSATILRTGVDGIPLRLTDSGAQAIFNQPDRVFLYSTAGVPLRFAGAGALSITTSALNVWSSASWPLAEGVEPAPSQIWNKGDGTALTLTGTYQEAANRTLTHNLTVDDPATSQLTADSFNLEKNQLLAFGALSLDIDPTTTSTTALTGGTAASAQLSADYILADDRGGNVVGAAGGDGRYVLDGLGGTLAAGSVVELRAASRGLQMRARATVEQGDSTLAFASVPDSMDFGVLPIPGSTTLAGRTSQDFTLSVTDNRPAGSPWRLDASLAGPLAAQVDGQPQALSDAVVYLDDDGEPIPLNEVPMTLWAQETGGNLDIRWAEGEGVVLRLLPGEIFSGVDYQTTIHWSLIDAP